MKCVYTTRVYLLPPEGFVCLKSPDTCNLLVTAGVINEEWGRVTDYLLTNVIFNAVKLLKCD